MNAMNLITVVKNNYYVLTVDQVKNRAYMTLMGYWKSQSEVSNFIPDIEKAIRKVVPGFTILIDFTQYTGSSSELFNMHVEAQRIVLKAEVSRAAEVILDNPVLKMFSVAYSKESGLSPLSFKNRLHAERWLDLYLNNDNL